MASPRFETVRWRLAESYSTGIAAHLDNDATLRKGSEKVSSASVSGYFWNGSPYWIFSWRHRRKDLLWRKKDDLCLSVAPP